MNINYFVLPGVYGIALKDMSKQSLTRKLDGIFTTVCESYKINPDDVINNEKCRVKKYVEVRQISMALFHKKLGLTVKKTGDYFNKNHATVIYACRTVKNNRQFDRNFREKTDSLFAGVTL